MKQKSLLLLLFVVSMQAQLIVNPNPFGINSGTITVTMVQQAIIRYSTH